MVAIATYIQMEEQSPTVTPGVKLQPIVGEEKVPRRQELMNDLNNDD